MATNKTKLALLMATSMLLFFSIFFIDQVGNFSGMVDYDNIWTCITAGYFPSIGVYHCETYPPAIIQLGKLFITREVFFKQFLLLLFVFITPLVLYKITNEPITIWFYFATTNYAWGLLTSSYFAQALSITMILSMYFLSDRNRIIMLFFLIITHSTAFLFGLGFYFLLLAEENFFKGKIKENWKKLLGCSPFWGQAGPPKIIGEVIANNSVSAGFVTINTLLSVFFKRTPIPFLYFSIKKLLQEKSIALLGFMIISFGAGFFIHERGFNFAALPMIIGLSWYYRDTSKKMKRALLVLSLIYFIFFLQQMIIIGLTCHG